MEGFPMTNTNLDIWAIQHYPQEIMNAIDGLEDSQENILYNNCRSYLRVGDKKLRVQFDTALICEDKERLILLQRDGFLTADALRILLNERNIPYNEVTFLEGRKIPQEDTREIWFARDKYVLDDALKDSKEKGIEICEYYPDLGGRFELRYTTDNGNYVTIHRQSIRGAMLLDDKIVLLLSHAKKRNVNFQQALWSIYDNDMVPQMVVGEKCLPIEQKARQYQKEQ